MTGEVRIRRPKDKEDLIRKLCRTGPEGSFENMAEALIFAAALGYRRQRREPFAESGEQIRYAVFHTKAEILINALAVAAYREDPAILADDRLQERVTVFEEFLNGGLIELAGEVAGNDDRMQEIVLRLVRSGGAPEVQAGPSPEIGRLLGGLGPATWE